MLKKTETKDTHTTPMLRPLFEAVRGPDSVRSDTRALHGKIEI